MSDALQHPPAAPWKRILAFAIIYFVWGSTFFFIRVGVRHVPPLLFAASRFIPAGAILILWSGFKGVRRPGLREVSSIFAIAFLIFVVDYGLLFWAEQRVPSGIAAIMMATIPAFMAVAEIIFLRTLRLSIRLCVALLVGIAGVTVLVSNSLHLGTAPIDRVGATALIIGSISWSIASALARLLPLPDSKVFSSGAQMLAGGLMLAVISALRGEWAGFQFSSIPASAWWACIYLAFFGSIIGFTAYVWLIHRESPTCVGTYAYVNPVVAVLLGYFFAGESIGLRTLLGAASVLASVVLITTLKRPATG